jgi:hypothetical protein
MSNPFTTYEKSTSIDWNGEMFVMTVRNEVGSNLYTYSYSYDGISWSNSILPSTSMPIQNPFATKWLGGDKYVIAGNVQANGSSTGNTSALASIKSNGVVAAPLTAPVNYQIYDVEANLEYRNRIVFPSSTVLAFGGVLADTTKIALSKDQGLSWTPASNSDSVFSTSCHAASWNGRRWTAVGAGSDNTLATSDDGGHTWTGRGKYIFSVSGNGIDWSETQSQFVAVGSGGGNVLAVSEDGVYWRGLTDYANLFTVGNDIKWNGSIWVAAGTPHATGNNKTLAYSYDGIVWSTPEQSDLFATSASKVAWNGTTWYAVGTDATYNLATSQDGIHWQMIANAGLSASPMVSVFADSETTLLSTTGSFGVLPSGSVESQSVQSNVVCNAAINVKTNYLLAGNGNVAITSGFSSFSNVAVSGISTISGLAWNTPNRGIPSIAPITIACGAGTCSLGYSIDGIQWIAASCNDIFTTRANKAAWNGSIWVAVGAGGNWAASSYDGMSWTARNSELFTEAYDVTWTGSVFVAVGTGASFSAATSTDGITWSGVTNSKTFFSTGASAVEWTGQTCMFYGSGGNTFAMATDPSISATWTTGNAPNLVITDASSALALGAFTASSSSDQSTYLAANAFDGNFNATITEWYSGANTYTASTGVYAGLTTTAYAGGTAPGEWLQVQVASSVVLNYYYLVFNVASATSIPKSWKLLGSTDGAEWALVDAFVHSSASAPDNDWKYPFVAFPLNIASNTASYSHYRIVFDKSFGGTHVAVADVSLFAANANSATLNTLIRPIVLKNAVLHPTQLLSVDGTKHNIYQITDLAGNLLRDLFINDHSVNNIVYGANANLLTSSCFDGSFHVVGSSGATLSYLSNEASNTHFNFDTSFNSATLTATGLTSIYGLCYNRQFIVAAGAGGSMITYGVLKPGVAPTWKATNASNLFTQVNGVASNPGYGFAVTPNTLYLKYTDKLSIISPVSYNPALQPETSFSFTQYSE